MPMHIYAVFKTTDPIFDPAPILNQDTNEFTTSAAVGIELQQKFVPDRDSNPGHYGHHSCTDYPTTQIFNSSTHYWCTAPVLYPFCLWQFADFYKSLNTVSICTHRFTSTPSLPVSTPPLKATHLIPSMTPVVLCPVLPVVVMPSVMPRCHPPDCSDWCWWLLHLPVVNPAVGGSTTAQPRNSQFRPADSVPAISSKPLLLLSPVLSLSSVTSITQMARCWLSLLNAPSADEATTMDTTWIHSALVDFSPWGGGGEECYIYCSERQIKLHAATCKYAAGCKAATLVLAGLPPSGCQRLKPMNYEWPVLQCAAFRAYTL